MKKLMGHVLWERFQKEEVDKVPIPCRRENHVEINKLNSKVDAILVSLDINNLGSLSAQTNVTNATPTATFLGCMCGKFGT